MASHTIHMILEKIGSSDKDYRYMATSDLLAELTRDGFRADGELERRLSAAVLKQLDDPSGDIANLAVRCFAAMVRRFSEARALDALRELCAKAAKGAGGSSSSSSSADAASAAAAAREIAVIGLKTCISELPPANPAAARGGLGPVAANVIVGALLDGIAAAGGDAAAADGGDRPAAAAGAPPDTSVADCLDVLAETVARFGAALPDAEASRLQAALLPAIAGDAARPPVRRRAIAALAAAAPHLPAPLLDEAVRSCLARLAASSPAPSRDVARALVQAVAAVARAAGARVGPHLDEAVPLLCAQARRAAGAGGGGGGGAGDGADQELVEHVLAALAAFFVRCPAAARPHLDAALGLALRFLRYDPNYAGSQGGGGATQSGEADDDDGGGEGAGGFRPEERGGGEEEAMAEDEDGGNGDGDDDGYGYEDDDDDFGGGGGYGDDDEDDDDSWKVRRAAARCVTAAVGAYPDLLPRLYARCAAPLVRRLSRERDMNVRSDAFHALAALVAAVGASRAVFGSGQEEGGDGSASASAAAGASSSPLALLRQDLPAIVPALARQLREKDPRPRAGAFVALRRLVAAAPEAVARGNAAALIVPGVVAVLSDDGAGAGAGAAGASALKVDALCFLREALAANAAASAAAAAGGEAPGNNNNGFGARELAAVAKPACACARERYVRVSAEAMRVCRELVRAVRPPAAVAARAPVAEPLASAVVAPLHAAVLARLSAGDQDQEVKEAAIAAAAAELASLADVLPACVGAGGAGGDPADALLRALLDRLRNETTRLAAGRALAAVAASPLRVPIDARGVVVPALAELTGFLRKAQRALRLHALEALQALADGGYLSSGDGSAGGGGGAGGRGSSGSPRAAKKRAAGPPPPEDASEELASGAAACAAEAAALVSDADLALAAGALRLEAALLLRAQPGAAAEAAASKALPAALALVRSPLLQGAALAELCTFFPALAAAGGPSRAELFDALLEAGGARGGGAGAGASAAAAAAGNGGGGSGGAARPPSAGGGAGAGAQHSAAHSAARCLAVLSVAPTAAAFGDKAQEQEGDFAVSVAAPRLLALLGGGSGAALASPEARLGLLGLGELGRRRDLSAAPAVEQAVAAALDAAGADGAGEALRAAAASALGGLACGNLPGFLPDLLSRVEAAKSAPKRQFLLLKALLDAVDAIAAGKHAAEVAAAVAASGSSAAVGSAAATAALLAADPSVDLSDADLARVLETVLSFAATSPEEECRAAAAECLGRLALLAPRAAVPALCARASDADANVRAVVAGALKHAAVERPHPVDAALAAVQSGGAGLCGLLSALAADPDRHVRRAAVNASAAIAHAKPALLLLPSPPVAVGALLPALLRQCEVDPSLVRVVDLGPFKHRIDDGLELRKAAFEALDLLLAGGSGGGGAGVGGGGGGAAAGSAAAAAAAAAGGGGAAAAPLSAAGAAALASSAASSAAAAAALSAAVIAQGGGGGGAEASAAAAAAPSPTLAQALAWGLADHYDVKLLAHAAASRLALSSPATALAALPLWCEPLEKTLAARLKSDAVKQEQDRHEEMLRSCLRCVDAIARLSGSSGVPSMAALMERTVAGVGAPMRGRYEAVVRDRMAAAAGAGAGAGGVSGGGGGVSGGGGGYGPSSGGGGVAAMDVGGYHR